MRLINPQPIETLPEKGDVFVLCLFLKDDLVRVLRYKAEHIHAMKDPHYQHSNFEMLNQFRTIQWSYVVTVEPMVVRNGYVEVKDTATTEQGEEGVCD